MYWVYESDTWYASAWYDGPWGAVAPYDVPPFILRVPVSYYRRPPAYFGGWQRDAAPRWGDHWGRDWERERSGWDRWDQHAAPSAAPLPDYQRQFSGNRYPRGEAQQTLRRQHGGREPSDEAVRRVESAQTRSAPAPRAQPQQRPQPGSRAQPNQPQPGPRAEPNRPTPQPGPRAEPNQPQPGPRAEPNRPAPQPQSQSAPRAEPRGQERNQGQDRRQERAPDQAQEGKPGAPGGQRGGDQTKDKDEEHGRERGR
jgi:hypothetical protein